MNAENIEMADQLAPLLQAYTGLCILAGQSTACSSDDVANVLYVINEEFQRVVTTLYN
ncbi:MAG: hypothetical protein COA63_010865 [Methylophaga sp.]|nr:hypothetical protein [Methylophaga sp.]